MNRLPTPKKQTQSKPVLSAVEWANFFKGQNELKIACQKIWPHPCEMVGINFLTIYLAGGIFQAGLQCIRVYILWIPARRGPSGRE